MEFNNKGTARELFLENPEVPAGTFMVEKDTGRCKLSTGRGVRWNELPYTYAPLTGEAGFEVIDPEFATGLLNARLHDTYTDKANGALGAADSGQTWARHSIPAGHDLDITSGKLGDLGSTSGPTAGYIDRDMGAPVSRIGGAFTFTSAGSTDGGFATLLVWVQSISTASSLDSPCHLGIGPTVAEYSVYEAGVQEVLATWQFDTPLAYATEHQCDVTLIGDTAVVVLPNGWVKIVTDSRIASIGGNFAGFEVFHTDQSTDHSPEFVSVWADARIATPFDVAPLANIYRTIESSDKPYAPVVAQYAASPADDEACTTGITPVNAANLALTVVAPPSGRILMELTGFVAMTGAERVLWIVSEGVVNHSILSVVDQQYTGQLHFASVIEGLTPGTSHDLQWDHFCTAGSLTTMKLDAANGYVAVMKATPLR